MPSGRGVPQKIGLFGHFGAGNFGNDSTLQATLCNLRRLVPDVELVCICTGPETVAAEYSITAVPISAVVVKPWRPHNRIARLLRKLCVGIPSEVYRWFQGIKILLGVDALIVVGTGLLTDFGIGPLGAYSVFKWSVTAKICRCKLLFVSVGGGPLERWRNRVFIKTALLLANFRSYRDEATLEYLANIGFRHSDDRVYPDLAFSLPVAVPTVKKTKKSRPVVGVGLMSHAGMYGVEQTTTAQYKSYLEVLVEFVDWLLKRDYDIRLVHGDLAETEVIRAFQSLMQHRSVTYEAWRVTAEPITSAEGLLSELGNTDFVVATRFHNVLLALFLNKPSIAISFHHKCSSLMSEMGLTEYCQDIRTLSAQGLAGQFQSLEMNADKLRRLIRFSTEKCRTSLEEQYLQLLREAGYVAGVNCVNDVVGMT